MNNGYGPYGTYHVVVVAGTYHVVCQQIIIDFYLMIDVTHKKYTPSNQNLKP
jgi:hypothetical protein